MFRLLNILVLAALLMSSALFVSGCGGGSNDESSGDSTPTSTSSIEPSNGTFDITSGPSSGKTGNVVVQPTATNGNCTVTVTVDGGTPAVLNGYISPPNYWGVNGGDYSINGGGGPNSDSLSGPFQITLPDGSTGSGISS